MNFFGFFRRKKETAQEDQPKVLLADGKAASPRLAALLPKLEQWALPCVRITARPSNELFLFDSKFAGDPYWPANKPYPVNSQGQYMHLLAQLNFSQVPPLEGYPEKGILQFFVVNDGMYGLDLDKPTNQENFRVVFWEDTTATPLDNFHFLDEQEDDGGLPVSRQMALQFTHDRDYYSFSDLRFPEEVADEMFADDQLVNGMRPLEEELGRLYPDTGHKIGGYAYFTQYDPRDEENKDYRDYILLLQIDSELDDICWGDVGVGNFFIHPDDLRRKDFSRVLYNWDCT